VTGGEKERQKKDLNCLRETGEICIK